MAATLCGGKATARSTFPRSLRPGLRFLPQSRSRLKLFHLQRAQVFRFAHGLPKPAWICVIFVNSFDPGGARRWRAREVADSTVQFESDAGASQGW